MNAATHVMMDVFHGYAQTDEDDSFARKYVHGLNKNYLSLFGYASETELLNAFKSWLNSKSYIALFANGAERESKLLNMAVCEFSLAPWVERQNCPSHKIAIRYKQLWLPVCQRVCSLYAHSSYVSPPPNSSNALSTLAKDRHGYHCALYDCVELYFQHILY